MMGPVVVMRKRKNVREEQARLMVDRELESIWMSGKGERARTATKRKSQKSSGRVGDPRNMFGRRKMIVNAIMGRVR